MFEEARSEPRSRNLPPSDSEKEAQTEPQPKKEPVVRESQRRNHCQGASGENPRQNQRQRACCEENDEVKQQASEDSEKNTKIWSDDEKNRELHSQQQAEEQSHRQAKQTK